MKNKLLTILTLTFLGCNSKPEVEPIVPDPIVRPVLVCTTSADQANLLATQTIGFATGKDDRFPVITIDTAQELQPIEGFGFTLTGGSATLLKGMSTPNRATLLAEFFENEGSSIGVSYLRLSIGASDLDAEVFSYDDLPAGDRKSTRLNSSHQ